MAFLTPATFPPAIHNHDLLYRPITYVTKWAEIPDKPGEIQLKVALESLGIYLDKTTVELNAIVPLGGFGIALDKTVKAYKIYADGRWQTIITGN